MATPRGWVGSLNSISGVATLMLIVATAGPGTDVRCTCAIQSKAVTRLEICSPSVHEETRTGCTTAPLATPKRVPAAMPATWVPCDQAPQSAVVPPPPVASVPVPTRPMKSWC